MAEMNRASRSGSVTRKLSPNTSLSSFMVGPRAVHVSGNKTLASSSFQPFRRRFLRQGSPPTLKTGVEISRKLRPMLQFKRQDLEARWRARSHEFQK